VILILQYIVITPFCFLFECLLFSLCRPFTFINECKEQLQWSVMKSCTPINLSIHFKEPSSICFISAENDYYAKLNIYLTKSKFHKLHCRISNALWRYTIINMSRLTILWYKYFDFHQIYEYTNIDKFFHCQNQKKICNNAITKDSTAPQVCHYTS